MTAVVPVFDQYMESLLAGNRQTCRTIIQRELQNGDTAEHLLHHVVWQSMERVDRLYRAHRINAATEHMAVRINRCAATQLHAGLQYLPSNGRRIMVASAEGEMQEINGQVLADLFEARGWEVYFIGGGVPNDEVLTLVGQLRPAILLICGTQPQGAPGVRALIDLIREVGAHPIMNVLVAGGVFNRADGLWKEVNADLYAANPEEALKVAESALPRKPEIRVPGAPKKRRRRRAPALAARA